MTPVPERLSTLATGPQVQAPPSLQQPAADDKHQNHHDHGAKPNAQPKEP